MAFNYDIPLDQLTDDRVERVVEKYTDSYDKQYMNGNITQELYDKLMNDLNTWAEEQYKWLRVKGNNSHLIHYNIKPIVD